ncbi:MAG: toxin-antitoxin system HicB family antitoxin [Planctomycetes bacterium]|nr:toxin-antitoxin system HicB family antitoxin [Planctomycetota bacterium]
MLLGCGYAAPGLPASLHRQAKELARQEEISINQLVATALAKKISALAAGEYLQKRAQRGSRRKFDRTLSKVKNIKPDAHDRLAAGSDP